MSEEKNNSEIDKPKKGLLKRILTGIAQSPLIKGVVKSLPFGNVIYEIGNNISTEKDIKKPHNWLSITIQILCLGGIVYAFISKQITIKELLDLFGVDFSEQLK